MGEIKELVTNPFEVPKNLAYAVTHTKETATWIGNSVKDFYDSYERDMLHGNAYSRSYWLTNAKGTIATAVLGTK